MATYCGLGGGMSGSGSFNGRSIRSRIEKFSWFFIKYSAVILCLFFTHVIPLKQGLADDRALRFQGITDLQLSIGTPHAANQCALSAAELERRGIALLSEVGLRGLTIADALERSRANAERVERDLQLMRSGHRLPQIGSPESIDRQNSINFMRDLPFFMILFDVDSTTTQSGQTICALGVSADFSAPADGQSRVAATKQQVHAPLLLWRHGTKAVIATPDTIQDVAENRLQEAINAMIAVWRTQNSSRHPVGTAR
jgi:hypothetical protein